MHQSKTSISSSSQGSGRAYRPLGRGLDDVSHVFLSQRADEAGASEQTWARPPERANIPAGARAGPVLLRPCKSFAKDQLAAILKEQKGVLEDGMRVIDENIPCDQCGEIDLLALDRTNQLIIVDIDTTQNDGLLLRGMGHFDWVVRNIPNIRRMYQGQEVHFSQPRLVLISTQFSRMLRSMARQITRPQISWVKYHSVVVSDGTGILFEHVEDE